MERVAPETHIRIPSTPVSRHRFHLLDGLRGLAAIIVVIWHGRTPGYFYPRNGNLSVDFFFCLSGFVIAFTYQRRLEEGTITFGKFFKARLIRLYPMYFLGICLGMMKSAISAIHHHQHILKRQILFFVEGLILVPNLSSRLSGTVFPLDNVAWSLFFELVANLLFAIFIMRRVGKRFYFPILVASLIPLVWWVGSGRMYDDMGWKSSPFAFGFGLFRVAFSFTLGVLVLNAYRRLNGWHPRGLFLLVSIALLFLLIAPFSIMQTGAFALLAIGAITPAMVFLGGCAPVPTNIVAACVILGEISYPLYLIHYLFVRPLQESCARAFSFPLGKELAQPCAVLILSAISYAVAKYVDSPVRRFISRVWVP